MSNNKVELDIDKIIDQLLSVRETPGKQVSLTGMHFFTFKINICICVSKDIMLKRKHSHCIVFIQCNFVLEALTALACVPKLLVCRC